MNRNEDMVFKPDLGRSVGRNARTRGAMDRKIHRSTRKGKLYKIIKRHAHTRMLRRAAMSRGIMRRMGTRAALRGAVGRGAATAGRAAATNPIGLVVVGAVLAGLVGLRLASGEPLEGWGEKLNEMLLGDLDEEARANMATRRMLSTPSTARALGLLNPDPSKKPVLPEAFNRRAKFYQELNKMQQDGESLFRRVLPVNSTIDMLIVRIADAIKRAWREAGGPEAVEALCNAFGNLVAALRYVMQVPGYLNRGYMPI
jgi:hypothetical protein